MNLVAPGPRRNRNPNIIPPEEQSIFGDTIHGVPNPNRAYTSIYPNRYHGPDYSYPVFGTRYVQTPYEMPLRQSILTHLSLGDTAPLFSSTTGNTVVDAALGAAVGYAVGSKEDKLKWAALGGVAVGIAGTFGLVGIVAAGLYLSSQRK